VGLFSRKPKVTAALIPDICQKMGVGLETAREQFFSAVLSTCKGEGVEVPDVTPLLEQGTPADSAVRGYQLAMVIGFCFKYMDERLWFKFDQALPGCVDNGQLDTVRQYQERYTDCQGNIPMLAQYLADDIYRLWDEPEPRATIIKGLAAGAPLLAMVSQAKAAASFGDTRTERKLTRLAGGGA